MDTDEVPPAPALSSGTENDVDMEDAKSAAPGSANAAQGDVPVQMETESKVRQILWNVQQDALHINNYFYGVVLSNINFVIC